MLNFTKYIGKWIYTHPMILAGIFAFGVPLAIYLIFPNENHTGDAVWYTVMINEGVLFHPQHLLYSALGVVLKNGLEYLGIGVSTITLMQTVDSLFAAICVLLFFIVLLRLSRNVTTSLIFALLFAFSRVLWQYAVEVEVYTCGLIFVIGSLLLIIVTLSRGAEPKTVMLVGLGVLGGFACIFHIMHILFVAVGCTFIYFTGKGFLPRLKMMALYLIPLSVLAGGSYVAAGYALNKLPNVMSFYYWLAGVFQTGKWGHFEGLRNFVSAVFGLQSSLLNKPIDFRNTEIDNIALNIIFVFGLILLLFLMAIAIAKFKDIYKSKASVVILSVVWIIPYEIFLLWWEPANRELTMHILPPIWLLLFLGFEKWQLRRRNWKLLLPVVFLCILFYVNLVCCAIPGNDIKNNDAYQLTEKLHDYGITSEDLVLLPPHMTKVVAYHILYFSSELRVTSLSELRGEIDKPSIFLDVRNEIEATLERGSRVLVSEGELNPAQDLVSTLLGESSVVKTSDHVEFYAPYLNRIVRLFNYQYGEHGEWILEIVTGP